MKTLLYGYSLVTMTLSPEPMFETTMKEAGGNPWFSLSTLLEYYDTMARLTIRDCSLGGLGLQLILKGGLDIV